MSDTNTDTNTVYIVSREKLIEFIENYIPDDAQFELRVLYEIMHRFVTSVDECSMFDVPEAIKGNMNILLNEVTTHHMNALQEFIGNIDREARKMKGVNIT